MMKEDKYLSIAKQAALEAGEIITKYFGKKHQYKFKNKDKSDFATQADLESEQKIIQILTKNFPTHNIIAEEGGKKDKGSEYCWVIDPLDGTFSFTVGMPYFGVSIGLLKDGKPILGVLYDVKSKEIYWGIKGKGAYLNGKLIHVSKQKKLIETGMVLDSGHRERRQSKIDLYINPLITKVGYSYSLGSAVTVLGLIARGSLGGTVNQAWIWDFVAGTVIVREAGGVVTDFEGNEPDWNQDRLSIVASNGLIHKQILKALSVSS